MKNFFVVMLGAAFLLLSGLAAAQGGNMMNGGFMGGYGGMWIPVLLAALVVGLVVWIVKRK